MLYFFRANLEFLKFIFLSIWHRGVFFITKQHTTFNFISLQKFTFLSSLILDLILLSKKSYKYILFYSRSEQLIMMIDQLLIRFTYARL